MTKPRKKSIDQAIEEYIGDELMLYVNYLMHREALRRHKTRKAAAKWLGVSHRSMGDFYNNRNERLSLKFNERYMRHVRVVSEEEKAGKARMDKRFPDK